MLPRLMAGLIVFAALATAALLLRGTLDLAALISGSVIAAAVAFFIGWALRREREPYRWF